MIHQKPLDSQLISSMLQLEWESLWQHSPILFHLLEQLWHCEEYQGTSVFFPLSLPLKNVEKWINLENHYKYIYSWL